MLALLGVVENLFICGLIRFGERLLRLTVIKAQDGILDSEVQPLYEFTEICYKHRLYSELENLTQLLASRHPLGNFLLARVLFALRRTNESEQLFLKYLSNLPPDTPQVRQSIA